MYVEVPQNNQSGSAVCFRGKLLLEGKSTMAFNLCLFAWHAQSGSSQYTQ